MNCPSFERNRTSITFKIHANHDGVRATAIMLRSTAARKSWRSLVIAVKEASTITSSALLVNKLELAQIYFPIS